MSLRCWIFQLLILLATGAPLARSVGLETATISYRYQLWDVFTDSALTGNQLAVFTAAEGLSADLMQRMAREMAFSETTFVFAPDAAGLEARVRIFSTTRELSFAGHPTIGTAFALAATGAIPAGTKKIVLGEGIGPIEVQLEWAADKLRFAWMHQRAPVFGKRLDAPEALAAALAIPVTRFMSPALPVQEVSCGSPYIMVPLASRAAVDQARIDSSLLGELFDRLGVSRRSLLVFSMEPAGADATVYSRMLRFDGTEDPATGGASGPLGAYLVKYGLVSTGEASSIVSLQGVQMRRPSRIHVRIRTRHGAITDVLVGGAAIQVGDGTLYIPVVDDS